MPVAIAPDSLDKANEYHGFPPSITDTPVRLLKDVHQGINNNNIIELRVGGGRRWSWLIGLQVPRTDTIKSRLRLFSAPAGTRFMAFL